MTLSLQQLDDSASFQPMRPRPQHMTKRSRVARSYFSLVTPRCVECGQLATLVPATKAFPEHGCPSDMAYLCECGARVRCHIGTTHALGYPANRETGKARYRAHKVFDQLWQDGPFSHMASPRTRAYRWLASELRIPADDCHFGRMDRQTCLEAIDLCEQKAFQAYH
jgi:hypothetical protein